MHPKRSSKFLLVEYVSNSSHLNRFLYMLFVCMDANFRLKNQLVSNYSVDPGLGIVWAYMVPREPYERYVLSQADEKDVGPVFKALYHLY